jgi:uncharacterized damage-inducible protein DinB
LQAVQIFINFLADFDYQSKQPFLYHILSDHRNIFGGRAGIFVSRNFSGERFLFRIKIMTTKEILLEQFTVCHDENGWFVALKNTLRNLTAEQAAWKPEDRENSIWEILAHLNFYNERYLRRFKGESIPPVDIENSETFTGAREASDEAWQTEIERLDRIMSEWRSLLQTADEAKLAQAVSAENQSPWWEVISNINAHSAHHGGQIVLIRKLQGSWDASKGVS